MMDSCLMCLEITSINLDCVRASSEKWQELNILSAVEKHFWPLSTIHCNSWICSACWRMVNDFHKFYVKIEEAHMKLDIKSEKLDVSIFCEQKLDFAQNVDLDASIKIKNEPGDMEENVCCVLGVEHQTDNYHFSQKKAATVGKSQKRKHSKEEKSELKNATGKVKKKERDLDDSNSASDLDYDDIDANTLLGSNSSEDDDNCFDNDLLGREEHDKIIGDYFKQINCDICKTPLDNFFAVLKHFFEAHQQKGYIPCCKTQFFNRNDLVDHIHSHSNPNHLKCLQCDQIFSDNILYEEHKSQTHRAIQKKKLKINFCDVCGKTFKNIQNFKFHKLSHLSKEEKKTSYQDFLKSKVLTEHPNSSKGKLEDFPPQSTCKSSCHCCQEIFSRLDTIQKQQNTILESVAEQKVLLGRLVAQNASEDNIMSIFPVNTCEQLQELDMLLSTQSDSHKRQIKSLINGDVERNLHHIFGQGIIMEFNVEGILGKKRLRDYGNVYAALLDIISIYNDSADKTLRTAFQRQKKKFFKQNSRNKIKKNA